MVANFCLALCLEKEETTMLLNILAFGVFWAGLFGKFSKLWVAMTTDREPHPEIYLKLFLGNKIYIRGRP
jgi:hypothetical protein